MAPSSIVRAKTGRDPVEVLQEAIQALTPHLEVQAAAASAAPPTRCRSKCPAAAPARWPSAGSSATRGERREKIMAERLAGEIMDALAGQGGAFKKKDDIFRMAQANKAFAHYRW